MWGGKCVTDGQCQETLAYCMKETTCRHSCTQPSPRIQLSWCFGSGILITGTGTPSWKCVPECKSFTCVSLYTPQKICIVFFQEHLRRTICFAYVLFSHALKNKFYQFCYFIYCLKNIKFVTHSMYLNFVLLNPNPRGQVAKRALTF